MVEINALAYARTHAYIRTWVCAHRREYRRNPEISSEYLNIPKEYFNIGGIFKYLQDNKIFEAWNGRENPNQASFIENQIKELSIFDYERAFWKVQLSFNLFASHLNETRPHKAAVFTDFYCAVWIKSAKCSIVPDLDNVICVTRITYKRIVEVGFMDCPSVAENHVIGYDTESVSSSLDDMTVFPV